MLKSSLCDYGHAYILVKGNITFRRNTTVTAEATNTNNKKVILKIFASFPDCISKINNTQIDNANDFDVFMPMYNLIEYGDNYSKASGILWQFCKDEPTVDFNCAFVSFVADNTTSSFKIKEKIID